MIRKSVLEELGEIVGAEGLLTEPEDLLSYSYDAFIREFVPHAVILPTETSQVSRIMEVASREEIPVVSRGAGTNLCGSSVARQGGVIVSFTRMNKILEIDRANRLAVVQPGVINDVLQKAVNRQGLFYPPDPASKAVCTIGGNVALNAGGPRAVKYGVTKDYLMGLEVVLADGGIITTGGRTVKNVTGYDLTQLMCGSEGTLGIITEIILKLVPMPPARITLLVSFSTIEAVSETVSGIMCMKEGIVPSTLDVMDKVILDLIHDIPGASFPSGVEAILMIEVDGNEGTVKEHGEILEKFCMVKGAVDVQKAETEAEAERLWEARRAYTGALCKVRPNVLTEDAVVPVSELPCIMKEIERLRDKHHLGIGIVAHAGDGNVHPEIMTDLRDEDEMSRVELFIQEMYEKVVDLRGTLSGEHGIGIGKSKYMEMVYNERELNLMRQIKSVFDPKSILNPGSFLTKHIQ